MNPMPTNHQDLPRQVKLVTVEHNLGREPRQIMDGNGLGLEAAGIIVTARSYPR